MCTRVLKLKLTSTNMVMCHRDTRENRMFAEKQPRPTQREPDLLPGTQVNEQSVTFLASGLYCSQAESTPAPAQVSPSRDRLQTVRWLSQNERYHYEYATRPLHQNWKFQHTLLG
jgi:hypothetical protein